MQRLQRETGRQRIPDHIEQFFDARAPVLQIQPAKQGFQRRGRPVLLWGGMLRHSGLCGIFAAAHHGPFGLVQQRRNDLQRRILPFGRHKFHRRRMQAVRHKARAFHKARAHQHLKHAVPHERQRYGRLLMDVYLRLCFK